MKNLVKWNNLTLLMKKSVKLNLPTLQFVEIIEFYCHATISFCQKFRESNFLLKSFKNSKLI